MSGPTPSQPYLDVFESFGRISIADLNPNLTTLRNLYVEATIVLVWPYSSSSEKLSLLLAEKDIRLRKSKGQVKVSFYGDCAREVAKLEGGIGDVIRLGLRDLIWTRTGEAVSTPGRKLDWDLELHRSVKLEIRHSNEKIDIVDIKARVRSQSPETVNILSIQNGNGLRISRQIEQDSLRAPAFRTPKRILSGSYVDKVFSPFTDGHSNLETRSGKRTKYARPSGSWQLLDDSDEESNHIRKVLSRSLLPNSIESTENEEVPKNVVTLVENLLPHLHTHSADRSTLITDGTFSERTTEDSPRANEHAEPISSPPKAVPMQGTHSSVFSEDVTRIQDLAYSDKMALSMRHNSLQSKLSPKQELPPSNLPFALPEVQDGVQGAPYFSRDFSPTLPSTHDVQNHPDPLWHMHFQPQLSPDKLFGFVEQSHEAGTSPIQAVPALPSSGLQLSPDAGVPKANDLASIPPLSYGVNIPSSQAIPVDFGTTFIDLEALQYQVEKESVREIANQPQASIAEDQDMYGSPTRMEAPAPTFVLPYIEDVQQFQQELSVVPHDETENLETMPDKPTSRGETTELSSQENLRQQFDGVEGPYEHELKRMDERAQLRKEHANETSNEFVEISSDDEERSGGNRAVGEQPEEMELKERFSAQTLQKEILREEFPYKEVAHEGMSLEEILVDDQRTGYEESLLQRPTSAENSESIAAVRQTSPPEAIRPDGAIEWKNDDERINQLPTPIATQQTPIIERHARLQEATQEVELPLSPSLTQSEPPPLLTEHATSQIDPEEQALPEMTLVDGQARLKTSSNRLSRKLLSSDPIGNEYFTPRRSGRVSKIQMNEITNDVSSDPVPSSPTSKRRPLRPSSADGAANSHMQGTHPKQSVASAEPLRSGRGLSTALSYYPRLSLVHEFHGREIDVMAICTVASSEPQKATAGPRDYHTTLHLVDTSFMDRTTMIAQIFRPRKFALPVASRGDVVVLRDMKVQSQEGKSMLLSTETSSWAVFKMEKEIPHEQPIVSINGPPIEYGQGEIEYVEFLKTWWTEEANTMLYPLANDQQPQEVGDAAKSRSPTQRHRRQTSAASGGTAVSVTVTPLERFNQAEVASEAAMPTTLSTTSTRMARSRRRKSDQEPKDNSHSISSTQVDGKIAAGVETQTESKVDEQSSSTSGLAITDSEAPMTTKAAIARDDTATRGAANITPDGTAKPKSPRRQRRRRGKSISTQPSESVVHELRDGTKYVDVNQDFGSASVGVGITSDGGDSKSTNHEGYGTAQENKQNDVPNTSLVHELRDGHQYIDR